MKSLSTIIATVTSLAVLGSALLVPAATAFAVDEKVNVPTCLDVTMIAAQPTAGREKNILAENPALKPYDGVGAVLTRSVNLLRSELPWAVDSEVLAAPFFLDSEVAPTPRDYRKAIIDGVSGTKDLVTEVLSSCPDTTLVLMGYGEGAQMMHELVTQLPEDQLNRTSAVWLISDPIKRPGENNQVIYAGDGVQPSTGTGSFASPSGYYEQYSAKGWNQFPETLKDRVISVCSNDDASCSGATSTGSSIASQSNYVKTPFTYYPTRWVAERINRDTALEPLVPKEKDECKDVTFIAARGSGEPDTGVGSGQPAQSAAPKDFLQGFGVTVASMTHAIKEKLPMNTTTWFIPIDYEALSVPEAMQAGSQYPRSVMSGITSGVPVVKQVISTCPDTKLVLLGYSQGAHLVHEIVMRLNAEERKTIASVVLIADAQRDPKNTITRNYTGNSKSFTGDDSVLSKGMGAMRYAAFLNSKCISLNNIETSSTDTGPSLPAPLLFFGVKIGSDISNSAIKVVQDCKTLFANSPTFPDVVSGEPFPDDVQDKVLNVCNVRDIVCQIKTPDPNLIELALGLEVWKTYQKINDGFVCEDLKDSLDKESVELCQNFKEVGVIHGEGYKDSGFYDYPAEWAYSRIARE